MKKGPIIFVLIIVLLFGGVIVYRQTRPQAELEEEVPPLVGTEIMQKGDIVLYRELVGTVEPEDVVYVYPKASGEITDVFVSAGDYVSPGQALCTIDTQMVESARLSMESARAAYENAQATYNRQLALYQAGDVAAATYEQAEASYKSAQIAYEQAQLSYNNQLDYSNVTASIGGKVESVGIEVHDNVSQASLICVISGVGGKSVTFNVPQKIVDEMNLGDVITLEKDGIEYQATISEIATMIDASTGLFQIKAAIDNGDALATNSTVSLTVISDQVHGADTIHTDSVYYSGGDAYVYIYDDGTVHEVPITVGIYDSVLAQVLGGLTPSDMVITTWTNELYEGSHVRVSEEDASAAAKAAATSFQAAEEPDAASGEDAENENDGAAEADADAVAEE